MCDSTLNSRISLRSAGYIMTSEMVSRKNLSRKTYTELKTTRGRQDTA